MHESTAVDLAALLRQFVIEYLRRNPGYPYQQVMIALRIIESDIAFMARGNGIPANGDSDISESLLVNNSMQGGNFSIDQGSEIQSLYLDPLMEPVEQQLSLHYPSDVTDAQWVILAPWFDAKPSQRGKKPTVARRDIVNAIFYVLREGCRWRYLPHTYPDWRLVYSYFRLWQQRGVFADVYETLHQTEQERHGRELHPSAAARGYDTRKKRASGVSSAPTSIRWATQ